MIAEILHRSAMMVSKKRKVAVVPTRCHKLMPDPLVILANSNKFP
jgi:hypothetical protein